MSTTVSRRPRRAREEEPEKEERTTRRSRRNDDSEHEEPRRSRRSESRRDDDDEEHEPRGRRPRSEERGSSRRNDHSRKGGWGNDRERRERKEYDGPKKFQVPEDTTLIKILDPEPIVDYWEHWLNELGKGRKLGYTCLDDDCPLCNIGDKPRFYAVFSVLDLTDPEDPQVKAWKASSTVTDTLENLSNKASLDATDRYFEVYKTIKKNGFPEINIQMIRDRDVEEDWDFEPFSQDELDEFESFKVEDVFEPANRQDLRKVANEIE